MAECLRRHDLLAVAPEAWETVLAGRPDLAGVPHLAAWAAEGRPVIVRRAHPDEDPGPVPVGLPLPPRDGKRRIGLGLPPGGVRRRAPVTLAEAAGACPEEWRPTVAEIGDLAARHALVPHLFGSLLWQVLTGLPYLAAGSDLDLLWPVPGAVPPGLLDGIAAIDARAPMRLDGEILLADGGGANWRELHAAAPGDTVLVKHRDRIALCAASAILAGEAA
ncbi:malonate decarboxylase holo-[acyl-carrier-protein] synthase [Methylobacterium sp. JK268]